MPARTGALRGGPLVLLVGAAVLRGLPAARALAAPSPVVGAAPLLDSPVYSLATLNGDGTTNANIVTYASPVGITPERLWAVSLWRGTRSHANFADRRGGVLQVLTPEHARVAHALGGVSADDGGADKAAACAALGLGWEPYCGGGGERVLPRCAGYLRLEAAPGAPWDAGDHDVFLCRVAETRYDAGAGHLRTGELRARGLVDARGRAVDPAAAAAAAARADSAAAAAPAGGGAALLRRAAAAVAALAAAAAPPALPAAAAPAGGGACREMSLGPLYTKRLCVNTGVRDGRLRGCLASENCVSSSAVKSPSQFGAPWVFSPATDDASAAFASLLAAIDASPDLALADADASALYARATARTVVAGGQGATDVDDVEFLLDADEKFVFYRSASREAIFLVPGTNIYSVPLGDGGSNRNRLEDLRKKLGWESTAARSEDVEDDPRQYQSLNSGFGIPTFGLRN